MQIKTGALTISLKTRPVSRRLHRGTMRLQEALLILTAIALNILSYSAYANATVVASVLPSSRSVAVGTPATLFATILNAGPDEGINCRIELAPPLSGLFSYQTTNSATNAPNGTINTPIDIEANAAQTFVMSLVPDAVQTPVEVELDFLCDNSEPASVITGVNTFSFSAAATPTPDVIALAATVSNDGVVELPSETGSNVFSVASVNVGSAGNLSVTAQTGNVVLPINIALCETDPQTSICINPTTPTTAPVETTIAGSATPTFGIFVTGTNLIPFDAATNRISVQFADSSGAIRGATSVAVSTRPPPPALPAAPQVSLGVATKTLQLDWPAVTGATFYRVLQNQDGNSGFSQLGSDIVATSYSVAISVHRFDFENAEFRVEACNQTGCTASTPITANALTASAVGYFKASNAEAGDLLTQPVVSADGSTFAVVALSEDSNALGVNGDQSDNSANGAGAVYVFRNTDGVWAQEAYIKAAAYTPFDLLGRSMSISADGNTLAFGVQQEDSGSVGIGGDPEDGSGPNTGAVYVYTRSGTNWTLQEFIKASNPGQNDFFGKAVSISSDGNTLAVGAFREDGNGVGVNADENNNSAEDSGAAYVFTRSGTSWTQQAYLKASNTNIDDEFGGSVHLSGDGTTLAVSAAQEDSGATGINGNETDNSTTAAGAVYVFSNTGGAWVQQAYVKPSNTRQGFAFGVDNAIDFSSDGNTMVVGSSRENSDAVGINGDESTPAMFSSSGAAYVFVRSGSSWSQQAFIKSSNAQPNDQFARALAVSADGNTLAVSAWLEAGGSTGFNGNESVNDAPSSGAVYLFERTGSQWVQTNYIKAPFFVDSGDRFGDGIALSGDGGTLLISSREDSASQGINGDQSDNSAEGSGAVFVY